MARKDPELDPRIGNDRVGLMLTRGQVKTVLGHLAIESQMFIDNARNIIAYGSSEKSGIHGNPLTPDQKRRAQYGLWGTAFKMIFLQDLGATDRSTDWADYVFDRIRSNQLPEPTDLYSGSIHEARWYTSHFADLDQPCSYRRGAFEVWENPSNGKRIHILDRHANSQISASEVRSLIEQRDMKWREHVPAKLWNFYEWEYPPELRTAVVLREADGDLWPGSSEYPVGTKLVRDGDPTIFILRDDGKWRPRSETERGKSMGD